MWPKSGEKLPGWVDLDGAEHELRGWQHDEEDEPPPQDQEHLQQKHTLNITHYVMSEGFNFNCTIIGEVCGTIVVFFHLLLT